MISKCEVSAKTVCPFLQDKWFWWVDLDDYRYAYGESPSYENALREMGEALKRLDSHHVKPRTLEDVLRDVWKEAIDYAQSDIWRNPDEVFVERADEIRELLGFEIDEPDTIRNELENNGELLGGDA